MSIEISILKELQNMDMTLVRTSDANKRKELTVILKEVIKI